MSPRSDPRSPVSREPLTGTVALLPCSASSTRSDAHATGFPTARRSATTPAAAVSRSATRPWRSSERAARRRGRWTSSRTCAAAPSTSRPSDASAIRPPAASVRRARSATSAAPRTSRSWPATRAVTAAVTPTTKRVAERADVSHSCTARATARAISAPRLWDSSAVCSTSPAPPRASTRPAGLRTPPAATCTSAGRTTAHIAPVAFTYPSGAMSRPSTNEAPGSSAEATRSRVAPARTVPPAATRTRSRRTAGTVQRGRNASASARP
ncbi:unannotated protein [freshwater metagenome]|uniref:Unannotated protein n=1 Tax=freshwater metagenome TaxID=449393 RepID=A0A6J7HVX8_9ZZZZ